MIRYIVDRVLQGLAVVAVMSFVIYGLIGLMPGDPIDLMISANPNLTSEDAARTPAGMAMASAISRLSPMSRTVFHSRGASTCPTGSDCRRE